MKEQRYLLVILLITMLITAGCTTPEEDAPIEQEVEENEAQLPERLNLIAQTPGRDYDQTQEFDILAEANGSKTLILWVSTGCSGCHDWSEKIAESMNNGSVSNDTRIISIHRYPAFETREDVIEVYASNNSSYNSLWPVLMPEDKQPAIDVSKGAPTEMDYAEAFGTPATPSFTILDGDGKTVWTKRNYRFDESVLQEAIEVLNS